MRILPAELAQPKTPKVPKTAAKNHETLKVICCATRSQSRGVLGQTTYGAGVTCDMYSPLSGGRTRGLSSTCAQELLPWFSSRTTRIDASWVKATRSFRRSNQAVQRTGASPFAQRQIEHQGRLALAADLRVMPLSATPSLDKTAGRLWPTHPQTGPPCWSRVLANRDQATLLATSSS